jgi:hypothetical protein
LLTRGLGASGPQILKPMRDHTLMPFGPCGALLPTKLSVTQSWRSSGAEVIANQAAGSGGLVAAALAGRDARHHDSAAASVAVRLHFEVANRADRHLPIL